jgi:hypothetical protein
VPDKNNVFTELLSGRRFEHPAVEEHRIRTVSKHRPTLHLSVTVLTLVAWLSISNHCALGALESARTATSHASCHGSASAPAKVPAKDQPAPCCKLLRATLVQSIQVEAQNYFIDSLQLWYEVAVVFPEQLHGPQSFELDTGPPFSTSFAESVLQRSILAHAPPFS